MIQPLLSKLALAGLLNSIKILFPKKFFAKQKEEGITRKLVGFEMQEKAIPRHDYEVVDAEGNVIGKVTSGTMSPMKKNWSWISLCCKTSLQIRI